MTSLPPFSADGVLVVREVPWAPSGETLRLHRAPFACHRAARLVAAHLSGRGELWRWAGLLVGLWATRWAPLRDPNEIDAFLNSKLTFAQVPSGFELRPPNSVAEAPLRDQVRACGGVPDDSRKLALASAILGARATLPELAGFLSHPVHGQPKRRWVFPSCG